MTPDKAAEIKDHERAYELLFSENGKLRAQKSDLLQELKNIANADVSEWDDPGEFRAWAQSRARHAVNKATGSEP